MSDHIGEIYRPYIIVGIADQKDTDGHKLYLAHCMYCDTICKMRLNDIRKSKCKLCNCNAVHLQNGIKNKRLQSIFRGMKERCYDSQNKSYNIYGGKGIVICHEWLKNPNAFEEWALNNGYNDNLTIDRIDSSKSYCPDNCRWVTFEDNARYKSTTQVIDIDGFVLTGKQWAKSLGLGHNTINKIRRTYGEELTKELIRQMLQRKPYVDVQRKPKQSWLDAYGIIH